MATSRLVHAFVVLCFISLLGVGIVSRSMAIELDGSLEGITITAPEGYELGVYQTGAVPNPPPEQPNLTDGFGMTVVLQPGQGIRIFAPLVDVGVGAAVIQCSVYSLTNQVVIAAAGLNALEGGTLESIDGSLATNQPVNGAEFLNHWETIRVLYDPLGNAVVPVVQAVNPFSETAILYLDRIVVQPVSTLAKSDRDNLLGITLPTPTSYPTPPEDFQTITITEPVFTIPLFLSLGPVRDTEDDDRIILSMDMARYTEDGGRLFLYGKDGIYIYNLEDNKIEFQKTINLNGIVAATVTSDLQTIFAGNATNHLTRWDASTGSMKYSIYSLSIPHINGLMLKISSDGLYLLTGAPSGTMILQNAATGRAIRTISTNTDDERSLHDLVFITFLHGSTQALAVSKSGEAKIWDTQSGETMKQFSVGVPTSTCAISNDDRLLAVGTVTGDVIVYALDTYESVWTLSGHTQQINACAFSDDASQLFTGGEDRTYRRWRLDTGEPVFTSPVQEEPIRCLDYSASRSALLVLAGNDLFEADATTGVFQEIVFMSPSSQLQTLSYGREGNEILTVGTDNQCMVWDAANGAFLREFSFERSISSAPLLFAYDGSKCAIQAASHTVNVIDTQDGGLISQIHTPQEIASPVSFSYDGEWLCCLYGNAYQIYESKTGLMLAQVTVAEDTGADNHNLDRLEFLNDRTKLLYVNRTLKACYILDTLAGSIINKLTRNRYDVYGHEYDPIPVDYYAMATSRSGEIAVRDPERFLIYRTTGKIWSGTTGYNDSSYYYIPQLTLSGDGSRMLSTVWQMEIIDTYAGILVAYIFNEIPSGVGPADLSPPAWSVFRKSVFSQNDRYIATIGTLITKNDIVKVFKVPEWE